MRRIGIPVAVLVTGILVAATGLVMGLAGYRRVAAPAGGMSPTFDKGARLVIRPISGDQARRGDIVVFKVTAWGQPDIELVKRVVAVGGDTVACCEFQDRITVNGRGITEEYIKTDEGPHPNGAYTATVEPGHVWVLGDNRGNSRDSRSETDRPGGGGVPVGDITGVVVSADGKDVTGATAFNRAGLPGEPYQDNLNTWTYVLPGGGGLLFVVGVVWLLVTIRKRGM